MFNDKVKLYIVNKNWPILIKTFSELSKKKVIVCFVNFFKLPYKLHN